MTLDEVRELVRSMLALLGLGHWSVDVHGPEDWPETVHDGLVHYFTKDLRAHIYIRHEGIPDDVVQASCVHEVAHLVSAEFNQLCTEMMEQLAPGQRAVLEPVVIRTEEAATLRIERAIMALLRANGGEGTI